jgi:hypothetical protein
VGSGGANNDLIELEVNNAKQPVATPAQLSGGAGQDTLIGGNGADVLSGDAGFDRLQGDGGNDTLSGGTEIDLLIGGAGADSLNGGDGFDIASYSTATTGVTVNLATGVNTGDATGDKFHSIEQIDGSPNNDNLTGNAGNNIFNGAEGNDNINGGDGDDLLMPAWGDDVINGGNGIDTLVIDYSTLPTQAVAWVGAGPDYYAYVRNAWGIGAPIKTNLRAGGIYEVNISDDGTTLAVPRSGIWVKKIHSNASSLKVASGGYDTILSDDGSKVVWESDSEIWIANGDGTQVRQLTEISNDELNNLHPTISGDGSTIAWVQQQIIGSPIYENKYTIFVANADGSNIRQIVNDDEYKWDLSLSADGSKISWSVYGYHGGVWVANTDGTDIRELSGNTYTNAYMYSSSMSADGSKVVWVRDASYAGDSNIYVANTDGSRLGIVPNTKNASEFSSGSLSGDGERVVFAKYDSNDDKDKLYVTSVDGTEPPILIDSNSEGWGYGSSTGPVISTYVDKGVSYTQILHQKKLL